MAKPILLSWVCSLTAVAYVVTLSNSAYQTAFQRACTLLPCFASYLWTLLIMGNSFFLFGAASLFSLCILLSCLSILSLTMMKGEPNRLDKIRNFHIDSKLKINTTLHGNIPVSWVGLTYSSSSGTGTGTQAWHIRAFLGTFAGTAGGDEFSFLGFLALEILVVISAIS